MSVSVPANRTQAYYDVTLELIPLPVVGPCDYPSFVAPSVIEFVQVATNGGFYGSPMVATFDDPPTPGNLLVAVFLAGQATPGDDLTVTFPTCWTVDVEADPSGVTDSRLPNVIVAHHVVLDDDPSLGDDFDALTVHVSAVSPDDHGGCLIVAEYHGLGSAPVVDLVSDSGLRGAPNYSTQSVTPTAGANCLIVANVSREPDYPVASVGGGFTARQVIQTGGGSRQTLALLDRAVSSASGSYAATWADGGDAGDWTPIVVFTPTT